MEIVGKIIQVLPAQEGVGRNGNPWKVQPYVLETLDQYPRKVHFEVFREFNGRWYTSIRAWRIQQGDTTQAAVQPAAAPVPAAAPMQAAPAAAPVEAAPTNVDPFDASAGDGTSDLPF